VGPDGLSAYIADDRAGLFWEVHSISPGLGRPWVRPTRDSVMDVPALFEARLPPAGDYRVSESRAAWPLASVAKHFTSCIIPLAVCSTPPQTVPSRRWLRPFYSGSDGISAYIADDRAGLSWDVHLISPRLSRRSSIVITTAIERGRTMARRVVRSSCDSSLATKNAQRDGD